MKRHIVHHYHIPALQFLHQFVNEDLENLAIDGAITGQQVSHPSNGHGPQHRQSLAVLASDRLHHALPAWASAIQARQIGGDPHLINKHQMVYGDSRGLLSVALAFLLIAALVKETFFFSSTAFLVRHDKGLPD